MARDVTHTESEPYVVTPEDIDEEHGDVAICQCGLSKDRPFCDGSHRATRDEDPDVRYRYENDAAEGPRRPIVETVLGDPD